MTTENQEAPEEPTPVPERKTRSRKKKVVPLETTPPVPEEVSPVSDTNTEETPEITTPTPSVSPSVTEVRTLVPPPEPEEAYTLDLSETWLMGLAEIREGGTYIFTIMTQDDALFYRIARALEDRIRVNIDLSKTQIIMTQVDLRVETLVQFLERKKRSEVHPLIREEDEE